MSKVVVFGDDSDVNDLGSNFRSNEINVHEDGKSSDEGKSSITHEQQRPTKTRLVSFDANIRDTSTTPPRRSSAAQLLLHTETSMRNFQQTMVGYSGSPQSSQKNNVFTTGTPKNSGRKTSARDGVADEIAGHAKLHRQKSNMGPKTAFEMQEVNDELSQGMTCGGE